MKPEYIRRISFGELDLLNDPFEDQFDLIICRNVVIYFTAETKKSFSINLPLPCALGGFCLWEARR